MTSITPREIQVWSFIAQGLTVKEIAGQLGISKHTVHRHREALYPKIGARCIADATRFAYAYRVLTLPAYVNLPRIKLPGTTGGRDRGAPSGRL